LEILPSNEDDLESLQQLYHQLNPELAGRLDREVRHESQTFIAKDEHGVSGVALVSVLDYGLYPYGIIHELSVRSSDNSAQTRRDLADSCIRWLADRGAVSVIATASDDAERSFFRSVGFQPGKSEMHRLVPMKAARQFWA